MGISSRRLQSVSFTRPVVRSNLFKQDTFSENNHRLFTGLVLDVLLKPWEKYVMSLKYSEVCRDQFGKGYQI